MTLSVHPYQDSDDAEWDAFLGRTAQGSFLHSRRFLSYHGDRFQDESILVRDEKGKLVAVFPAAVSPLQPGCVVSHPGLTHAGLLFTPSLRIEHATEALALIMKQYRQQNIDKVIIKPVPLHCHRTQMDVENWLYWRAGGQIGRTDLWNTVGLVGNRKLNSHHKRAIKRAVKSGILLRAGSVDDLGGFHQMLRENLAQRHDTSPVHDLCELQTLFRTFPEQITLRLAEYEGHMCAGVLFFRFDTHTIHSQYIASTNAGRSVSALHMLLEDSVCEAEASGFRYFSFGASTENAGETVNSGLYHFKSAFGAGSTCALHWCLTTSAALEILGQSYT